MSQRWTDGLWTCTKHDDGSATFATELGTEDTEVAFVLTADGGRLFVGVQQAGTYAPAAEVVIHTSDVKTILTQIRFLCRAYSIGDYPSEASIRRAIEK